jgi:hypothetical protein
MFGGDIGIELLHSSHMNIERWWFEYDGGHGSNTNFIKIDKTLLVLEISQRRPVGHEDVSDGYTKEDKGPGCTWNNIQYIVGSTVSSTIRRWVRRGGGREGARERGQRINQHITL